MKQHNTPQPDLNKPECFYQTHMEAALVIGATEEEVKFEAARTTAARFNTQEVAA